MGACGLPDICSFSRIYATSRAWANAKQPKAFNKNFNVFIVGLITFNIMFTSCFAFPESRYACVYVTVVRPTGY